jgi:phospholipid-binding lipoprotein MlaA
MINRSFVLSFFVAISLFSMPVLAQETETISDPFEGYNRVIFKFNDAVDQNIMVPVVKGYRAVVPPPVRNGVHNVLTNLKSPITIGNQLLQGDLTGAADATTRMVVNTLLGLGGIFDVAADGGLENEPEDFGQTLAVWGVPHGPYVIVPFLPPSSVRDYSGTLADMYVDPTRLWLMNTDREGVYYAKFGVGVLDTRNEFLDALADLRKNAIDYYATVRSAYAQRRAAEVADSAGSGADIPDYSQGE